MVAASSTRFSSQVTGDPVYNTSLLMRPLSAHGPLAPQLCTKHVRSMYGCLRALSRVDAAAPGPQRACTARVRGPSLTLTPRGHGHSTVRPRLADAPIATCMATGKDDNLQFVVCTCLTTAATAWPGQSALARVTMHTRRERRRSRLRTPLSCASLSHLQTLGGTLSSPVAGRGAVRKTPSRGVSSAAALSMTR